MQEKQKGSRIRGGSHLLSKSAAARLLHNRQEGNFDGMDLEDEQFNKRFRTKGAGELPYREPRRNRRPQRENPRNE